MELYNGLQFLIMKYIITESRLENLIFKFLDSKLDGAEPMKGKYSDIVFISPKMAPNGDEELGILGWEKTDKGGKLYVFLLLVRAVEDMFSLQSEESLKIIARYIENRYNLNITSATWNCGFEFAALKVDN
jgi:hypothetical protein